jgi:hypothetical protein
MKAKLKITLTIILRVTNLKLPTPKILNNIDTNYHDPILNLI